MKITILGSGTSTGVPEYKCQCDTCQDARIYGSKNYRSRTSIHVEITTSDNIKYLQFDVGPNFIDQIDRCQIDRIDAVIYTHCHADHISGTNDLVMPCRKQNMDMPIYGPTETMSILQRNFDYMFRKDTFQGGGVAHLVPNPVTGPFNLFGLNIVPIPVQHGTVDTFGYRIQNFGYIPDVKLMPSQSLELLKGVDLLIIDALSFNPGHPTHFSVQDAIAIWEKIQPKNTYLIHMMHRIDHRYFNDQCSEQGFDLPESVRLSFDGQVLQL